MHRDRTLRHLHFVITGKALALLVGALLFGLADKVDALFSDLRRVANALGIEFSSKKSPTDGHGVGVVDGHHPAQHGRALHQLGLVGRLPDRPSLVAVRQDGFGGARPPVVLPQPGLHIDHSQRGLAVFDFLLRPGSITKLGPRHAGVQVHHMHRVLGVLVHLQPIAGDGK